jgi:hypothetical protein
VYILYVCMYWRFIVFIKIVHLFICRQIKTFFPFLKRNWKRFSILENIKSIHQQNKFYLLWNSCSPIRVGGSKQFPRNVLWCNNLHCNKFAMFLLVSLKKKKKKLSGAVFSVYSRHTKPNWKFMSSTENTALSKHI